MTPEEQSKLDKIADRLGSLYQAIGRIKLPEIYADAERDLLDCVLAITQDVETISGRDERAPSDCH